MNTEPARSRSTSPWIVTLVALSLIPITLTALSRSPVTDAPTSRAEAPDDDRIDVVERRLASLERAFENVERRQKKIAKAIGMDGREKSKIGRFARGLFGGGTSANESAAIATLRNLTSAQAQLQATAAIDANDNGAGEYGGFAELSGGVKGRAVARLTPPLLSTAFRNLTPAGECVRNGYVFRIYLVGENGAAVGEPQQGFTPALGIDAELAEVVWCCYAWPLTNGKTGDRTFMTNQQGDLVETKDDRHSGEGGGPKPGAAFVEGDISKSLALNRRGIDGNTWSVVR